MYLNSDNNSSIPDIADFFDKGDLFNSSVIYYIPFKFNRLFRLSHLNREDLISDDLYDNPNLLGAVLFSGESTVLDDEKNISYTKYYKPSYYKYFIDIDGLKETQSKILNKNTLTKRDINTNRKPEKMKYNYNGSIFVRDE